MLDGNPPPPFNPFVPLDPPNVLVLPQLLVPQGPIVPGDQPMTATVYTQGCCDDPSAECVMLIHDAVSGWWFPLISSFDCCTQGFLPDDLSGGVVPSTDAGCVGLPQISILQYFELIANFQDACYSEGTPLLQGYGCPLPDWAVPDNWAGECVWDEWTVQCIGDGENVRLTLKLPGNPGNPPPGNPPGPHVGYTDPPLPLASDGIGFSKASNVALPVHPTVSYARILQTCGACGESAGVDEGEEALP